MKQTDIKNTPLSKNIDNKRPYAKLDHTITDINQRNKIVHQIINTTPPQRLTPYYLEELTRYLVETQDNKKEKKNFNRQQNGYC